MTVPSPFSISHRSLIILGSRSRFLILYISTIVCTPSRHQSLAWKWHLGSVLTALIVCLGSIKSFSKTYRRVVEELNTVECLLFQKQATVSSCFLERQFSDRQQASPGCSHRYHSSHFGGYCYELHYRDKRSSEMFFRRRCFQINICALVCMLYFWKNRS